MVGLLPCQMEQLTVQSKRPLWDDEGADEASNGQRKVRFPKGKKQKNRGDFSYENADEEGLPVRADPQLAATERAVRRNKMTEELLVERGNGVMHDVSAAEVSYVDGGDFEEDGVLLEPFNLNQEREEGYFDAEGNFVEYVSEREVKDAWLDSLDANTKLADGNVSKRKHNQEVAELSSAEVGRIKRRIADLLQPGETVLHALRRLKRTSSGKKEKMSEDTKRRFDQLTEDAMKLMENDVYNEEQEVFEREAEGYERLAQAREGTAQGPLPLPDLPSGPSTLNLSSTQVASSVDGDSYDMFGDDDENPPPRKQENESDAAGGGLETDYVYDEASGYYYSSSLGYYYDPSSGLYCCATSGKWYSYNEQTGGYDEVLAEGASGAS